MAHNTKKIVLTPQQEKYLIKHFQHTKNDELMQKLGLSNVTLHRFAKTLGLKKSKQFMNRMQREASEKAKVINEQTNYRAQRIAASVLWDNYRETGELPKGCFQRGVTQNMRIGKKRNKQRIEKAQKKRNETIARDKRRVRLGLDPLTNLVKLRKINREQATLRSNMKSKKGYIVFRGDVDNVYYDSNTNRSEKMEQHAIQLEMSVRPIEERHLERRVIAIRTGSFSAFSDN